jgi:hypothetical protein
MPMSASAPASDHTVVWPSQGMFAPTPPEPEPRWTLTLDDGRTIEVEEFALIGRDPELSDQDPDGELVAMIDPEMSVSKTHAAFGVDEDGLWFLDRRSTNGTSVVAPGESRVALAPGVQTWIAPGSEVWIGRRQLWVDFIEEVEFTEDENNG